MGQRRAKAAVIGIAMLPLLVGSALAQDPSSAWFGGLGASINATSLDQDLQGGGTTNIFQGGVPDSIGISSGPSVGFHGSDNQFSPEAQLGYFEHFAQSDWLWGFKLNYQYDVTDVALPAVLPQSGQFTVLGVGTTAFDGDYVVGSAKTRIKHQLSLFPFLGHSFANGFLYGGGGPMLLDVQTTLSNVEGFAQIYGERADITGGLATMENSKWVWGAGLQAGMTYFLGSSWFVDLNYTFSRTQRFSNSFTSDFTHTFAVAGTTYTSEGVANFGARDRLTTQAVSITVNKAF